MEKSLITGYEGLKVHAALEKLNQSNRRSGNSLKEIICRMVLPSGVLEGAPEDGVDLFKNVSY